MLNLLLKKDKNGNLKASRVLELKKIAKQVGDSEFIDGVKIIEAAYRPNKSSTFIECCLLYTSILFFHVNLLIYHLF